MERERWFWSFGSGLDQVDQCDWKRRKEVLSKRSTQLVFSLVTIKYYYISPLADFYIEVHTKKLLFHTPTTTDMSYSTSSLLTFSSTNVEKDRNREIFDKTIQARQQNLTEILPTYTEETNAKIYVYEVKTLVENSGLGHHQGLVIAALMKAMPMNTRLGKRLRVMRFLSQMAIVQ